MLAPVLLPAIRADFFTPVLSSADVLAPNVYSRIVVLGASLMEQTFGTDLINPNVARTAEFKAGGLDVDVIGYGAGGDGIVETIVRLNAAMAQYTEETLFVIHTGGNDMSPLIPYAFRVDVPEETEFRDLYDDLLNATGSRKGDVILTNLTFRSYSAVQDDLIISNSQSLGSKPFNERIVQPAIASWRPEILNTDGSSVLDLYNITRNAGLPYLYGTGDNDGTHPSTEGADIIAQAFIDRLGYLINGGSMPSPVVPIAAPGLNGSGGVVLVNFGPQQNNFGGVTIDNLDNGQAPRRLYYDDCSPSNLYLQLISGAAGSNDSGRNVGSTTYDGTLSCNLFTNANLYSDNANIVFQITGAVANASYQLNFMASREAGDERICTATTNGISIAYNATANPPDVDNFVTVTATASGEIDVTIDPTGQYGYINGLTIEPL